MSPLPESLITPVRDALRGLGDATAVRSVRTVGGGCINNATRIETAQGVYFLKWNSDPLPGMFQCEARGLSLLAEVGAVRVPAVLAAAETSVDQPAFILLEWLEGSRNEDQAQLGEQLAALHREGCSPQNPPAYGLDHDNYIGQTPQINRWETDWPQFFTQNRIRAQMELASRTGHLNSSRRHKLERLVKRLPDLLSGVERRPALIHGDLWGGNVLPGPNGLAIIDPAVYYADRETEIAFTELFGGFGARFYAAYQSAWPLEPGYPERRNLYNLYHLLNHLNMFGESYSRQVDAVLRRYAG